MPSPKAPQPIDMRLPGEQARDVDKARADQERLGMFRGLQGQADLGYASSGRGQAINQPYERLIGEIPEDFANLYASAGFGPKGVGPQAAGAARETRLLGEQRASQESADIANYRQWVETFGESPLSVGGPVVATP